MSQRVRRQHVVSAFYLRGFADKNDCLVCTPLSGRDPYPVAVSDATVRKDFYTVTLGTGEPSDYFERAFSDVEAIASRALSRLIATASPLTGHDDRIAMSTWIALQHLRAEAIRTQGLEMQAQLIKIVVGASGKARLRRHIEKHEGAPITDARLQAEWDDLTQRDGPKLLANPISHLRTVYDLLPGTAALIRDSPWMIIHFTRKSLTTADHPVSLIRDPNVSAWYGTGLATAWGYGVPIARRLGLIVLTSYAANGLPDVVVDGTTAYARLLNFQTIEGGRRALYHHPDDDPRDWFERLPTERRREMRNVGEGLIREEGLFPEGVAPSTPVGLSSDNSDGFGLDDLEWPIPGRVFEWHEPNTR